MKKLSLSILILTALGSVTSHAIVAATTSFETSDNFAEGNNQTSGYTVTAADSAIWTSGPAGQYAGTWTGQKRTGDQSSVLGNAGRYITVDAAGAEGVGTIEFSWERYTTTSGNLTVQWTTDSLNGGETWTDAKTISITGDTGGGWTSESVSINRVGDVKVRLILAPGTTGGASIDDVTVNAPPPSTHHKLFILTGQSNSLGTTNGGEADTSPGTDPADAHVKFFWHNWAGPSTSLGDSGGDFTSLQSQQGGYYPGSVTHWGPEMHFGRMLYRAGVRDFGIIKCSRGGGGNSLWSKSSSDHHMYSHVVNAVNTATASLTAAGDTFEIVGLLYLQGESDSTAEASIAGTRIKELTDNLRADLPNAANLHCVIGGIARPGATSDTVRAKHAAIADSTDYIDYFTNLDLQTSTAPDNLHFNKAAKLTIGGRYTQAFFDAGVVTRHYGKLAFIGDSITQGGNGDHPSYRYQVFKRLAEKGVPADAETGYQFTGSVTGGYANSVMTTPNVNGQVFVNVHDGHFGWRASWINARVALPAGRYNINNLGQGSILNWTGTGASPSTYQTQDAPTTKPYTGTTYTPDTAVIMVGINDLGDNNNAAVQVIADIGTLIDQLRASNPALRIHVNRLLYTNQTQSMRNAVDAVNGQLPALVATKNAASSTSPVWLIDASTGFNPATQTYDNVHPNTNGEAYVGDRVAAALGVIETPQPSVPSGSPEPPHQQMQSGSFGSRFEGNEIHNGLGYVNGWAKVGTLTETLTPDDQQSVTDLKVQALGTSAAWVEGSNAGWSDIHEGDWTLELRIKFNANPNGFMVWLGTGAQRIMMEIHGDRTQDLGGQSFNVAHNNVDGQFHVFRIAHESVAGRYHVWRDGIRLTSVAGASYDGSADGRMILGDYTSGTFGNDFDVTIDHLRFDGNAAFLPVGADADSDGMPDYWEYHHFGDITTTLPGDDADNDGVSNLDEYTADTGPNDLSSRLRIESIVATATADEFIITTPNTSTARNYTLQESDDLGVTDAWIDVSGQGPTVGNDGNLVFTASRPSSATKRFYRVEVTIP